MVLCVSRSALRVQSCRPVLLSVYLLGTNFFRNGLILISECVHEHFLFHLGLLSLAIHKSQDSRRRRRLFIIPLYQFHPLQEHLEISRVVTVETSPLHMHRGQTHTENSQFLTQVSNQLLTPPESLNCDRTDFLIKFIFVQT